jgi:HD-GYP domain-containing protein (c-di-GMP phosphodiesterase class II)
MIASNRFTDYAPQRDGEESVLAHVPRRAFGDTAWVSLALKSCAQHLAPAIRSGKPQRIANAVRAVAHAPTAEQIDDIIDATCEAMLASAYATGDTRSVSHLQSARSVIGTIVGEVRGHSEREALIPVHLRDTVDAYIQLASLSNKGLAECLDAVGKLAVRIGAAMHLSVSTLLEIELAGRLHDIGMLGLAGTSYAVGAFERHPVTGAAFLESIPSLAHLAPIVRAHHERFDGRGYPDGFNGAEIPLASRIIGVAAEFVDLVTGSPARNAMLPNAACHDIALRAGSEFDPEVVTATLHLLRYRQRTHRSA